MTKKYRVPEEMRKQMDQTMKELANNKDTHSNLEETIYQILKELEAKGYCTKMSPSQDRFVRGLLTRSSTMQKMGAQGKRKAHCH